MELNLANTYNDMIRKYNVLQSKINDDIVYSNMIGDFIPPNCFVTVRSRREGPGKNIFQMVIHVFFQTKWLCRSY